MTTAERIVWLRSLGYGSSEYEPKIYKAVESVFKDAYEYTAMYRQYCRERRFARKADWGRDWNRLFANLDSSPDWLG